MILAKKNVRRQIPKITELAPLLKFALPALPSRKKRLAKALTIWDLREIAKRRTPTGPFDYTDGSAESELTLDRARRAFLDLEFRPNILQDVSKVSIIGVGMITTPGITYRMFQALASKKINIMVISTSEIKISVLISNKQIKKAVAVLHKEFKLD